jgi:predicted ATP-dependent endonuclease of OLD family
MGLGGLGLCRKWVCLLESFHQVESMSLDRAYIKSVNLKGYKTIRDLSATFNPGLNIIIGKNGGGKTNFMTFLNNALTSNTNALLDTSFDLELDGTVKVKLSADRTLSTKQDAKQANKDLLELINSSKGIFKIELEYENTTQNSWEDIQKPFNHTLGLISPIHIPHGLRKTNLVLDDALTFMFSLNAERKFSRNLVDIYGDKINHSHFARMLALNLLFYTVNDKAIEDEINEDQLSDYTISEAITDYIEELLFDINNNISIYLPIEAIRLNPNFKVSREDDTDSVTVSNIAFEYRVNGSWLQFGSLSDGTKRLLSIFLDIFSVKIDEFKYGSPSYNEIVLLEEPELGIHPHLLTNFLKFIQEYSQYMQIIITTHAPLSLNIVGEDDLDMINICKYDPAHGTTLTKLTDEQKEHAKLYMKDMYLSDYWQYSTLED